MKVKVGVRADSSIAMGSGHVRRCLTLTDVLPRARFEITFFIQALEGHLADLIRSRGCNVKLLPMLSGYEQGFDDFMSWDKDRSREDASNTISAFCGEKYDWFIVDHYGIDVVWERLVSKAVKKLFVLDDLANRHHDCDLLLDQNLGRVEEDYELLLNENAVLKCGPKYALLRSDFAKFRDRALERRENCRLESILVFMGGTDPENVTHKVLLGLLPDFSRLLDNVYVVMGSAARGVSEVRELLKRFDCNTKLLIDTENIHEYMMMSDIAVGAAGGAAWERCCLGLPALIITIADNQVAGGEALAKCGAAQLLRLDDVFSATLTSSLRLVQHQGKLRSMSRKAASLCDGHGVDRIIEEMSKIDFSLLSLRRANSRDETVLLNWANDPLTRINAINQDLIDKDSHHAWYKTRLKSQDQTQIYIIGLPNGYLLGQVRFEKDQGAWIIDYSLDAKYRGRGLGLPLLSKAIGAFEKHHSTMTLRGVVRIQNQASARIFEKLLFKNISEDSNFVTYEKRI